MFYGTVTLSYLEILPPCHSWNMHRFHVYLGDFVINHFKNALFLEASFDFTFYLKIIMTILFKGRIEHFSAQLLIEPAIVTHSNSAETALYQGF